MAPVVKRRRVSCAATDNQTSLGQLSGLPIEIIHKILFNLVGTENVHWQLRDVYNFFFTCKFAFALKQDFFHHIQCQLAIFDTAIFNVDPEDAQEAYRSEQVLRNFIRTLSVFHTGVKMHSHAFRFVDFYNHLLHDSHETVMENGVYVIENIHTHAMMSRNLERHIFTTKKTFLNICGMLTCPMEVCCALQPVIFMDVCNAINFEEHFFMSPWEFYIQFYCQDNFNDRVFPMPTVGLISLMSMLKRHLKFYSQTGKPKSKLTGIVVQIAHDLAKSEFSKNRPLNIMFISLLLCGGMCCDTALVANEYFKHAPKFSAKEAASIFMPELLLGDDEYCEDHVCSFDLQFLFLVCELDLATFRVFVDNVDGDRCQVFKELMRGYVSCAQKWDDDTSIPLYLNNVAAILHLFDDSWQVQSWENILGGRDPVEFLFPTSIVIDSKGQDGGIHNAHCGYDCAYEPHAMDDCDEHWFISKFVLDTGSAKLAALTRWEGETHSAILHNFAPWAMAHPQSHLMSVGDGVSLLACDYAQNHMKHWGKDAIMYAWMEAKNKNLF